MFKIIIVYSVVLGSMKIYQQGIFTQFWYFSIVIYSYVFRMSCTPIHWSLIIQLKDLKSFSRITQLILSIKLLWIVKLTVWYIRPFYDHTTNILFLFLIISPVRLRQMFSINKLFVTLKKDFCRNDWVMWVLEVLELKNHPLYVCMKTGDVYVLNQAYNSSAWLGCMGQTPYLPSFMP